MGQYLSLFYSHPPLGVPDVDTDVLPCDLGLMQNVALRPFEVESRQPGSR